MYQEARDCLLEAVSSKEMDKLCSEFYDKTKEMNLQLKLAKKNFSGKTGEFAVAREVKALNAHLDKLRDVIIKATQA